MNVLAALGAWFVLRPMRSPFIRESNAQSAMQPATRAQPA